MHSIVRGKGASSFKQQNQCDDFPPKYFTSFLLNVCRDAKDKAYVLDSDEHEHLLGSLLMLPDFSGGIIACTSVEKRDSSFQKIFFATAQNSSQQNSFMPLPIIPHRIIDRQ
jgi:hypothetical protein